MKPDERQKDLLKRVTEAHDHEIDLKRSIRERVEQMMEEEMEVARRKTSRWANEALVAGISRTRIGKALRTSNWQTVRDVLALVGDEYADALKVPTQTDPDRPQYEVFAADREARVTMYVYGSGTRWLDTPRVVELRRHQGVGWDDPSRYDVTPAELGLDDSSPLAVKIVADMEKQIRAVGKREDVRLLGVIEDDSQYEEEQASDIPEPDTPEFRKWQENPYGERY